MINKAGLEIGNDAKLSGIVKKSENTVKAFLNKTNNLQYKLKATDENNLVELDETTENENVEKGTLDKPREVVTPSKPTKAQEDKINEIKEHIENKTFGYKNLEVTDNVVYKDEDGNITKQETIKENKDGEKVKTTVKYDEKGRVIYIGTEKYKDNYPIDGEVVRFEYQEDGSIKMQRSYEWGQENDCIARSAVYIAPISIDKDGKISIKDNILGRMQQK